MIINSHEQGLGILRAVPDGTVTVEHCRELLKERTYFDYLYGRIIKVNLSKDEFEEWLYDRDNRIGAAQMVIDNLKSKHGL